MAVGDGTNIKKDISLLEATAPLITMLASLIIGGMFIPVNAEFLIVVLLFSAIVAGISARRFGFGWKDIQKSTGDKISYALPAVLILLSIGILIGSWMYSGTIPMLVYYGIQLVNPEYIVLTAFLVTAVMSLTGSSWAAAGTIGVALIGVAAAMEAPMAATAGAIVSGAYFGDKLSPLSDSTNVCALGAGANLYDHIRHMLYTAGPSFVVAFTVYLFVGFFTDISEMMADPSSSPILGELEQIYTFSWILMLPPLIVIVGTFKRYEAALAMGVSSIVAIIVGLTVQDFSAINALKSAIVGFNGNMVGGDGAEHSDMLLMLLNRGGIYSMSNTLILIISAFLLAGAMDLSGALSKLLHSMLQFVNSIFSLIAATLASGIVMVGMTSHNSVSALIVGGLFEDSYKEQGLATVNLSRSMEDSITILESLMPWTVSGMYMAVTLGVPTVELAPWAVFNYCGLLFSLLIAATYKYTGFGIKMLEKE
ncbi:MAG: Na+/H+ antiporter NhaC [Kordiimonadaceae bacterium]|jgi:Na+:H+ antiporter, NhaC family|nr:Na+/H+ antiporter NhaC [Kordiimonadaceae bacterium]MBT6033256.1 Na+/H+ antiporter NhaC [Kordiimonadaceae bacterium]